ncbi:MAG: hypothetical protein FWE37_02685 [Spirochaetaceae bacterium]|nr:hypothetical protein [Spirochaetaceae bacterium]
MAYSLVINTNHSVKINNGQIALKDSRLYCLKIRMTEHMREAISLGQRDFIIYMDSMLKREAMVLGIDYNNLIYSFEDKKMKFNLKAVKSDS